MNNFSFAYLIFITKMQRGYKIVGEYAILLQIIGAMQPVHESVPPKMFSCRSSVVVKITHIKTGKEIDEIRERTCHRVIIYKIGKAPQQEPNLVVQCDQALDYNKIFYSCLISNMGPLISNKN